MNKLSKDNIFYTLFKDKDELLLQEVFAIGKREAESKKKNSIWIRNKLTRWKKEELQNLCITQRIILLPLEVNAIVLSASN